MFHVKHNLIIVFIVTTTLQLFHINYCAMNILPYQDEYFVQYHTKSVQYFLLEISKDINSRIFFATFVKNIETYIKSNAVTKALKQLIWQQIYHI